jgi:hypothetical protein
MKPYAYIRTSNFKLISGLVLLLFAAGCEIKEDTPKTKNIYKAKPLNKITAPPKKEESKKEEQKIETPSIDSISVPSDSTKMTKDTTETLQHQKKPEIRSPRRYSQFNIHRRGYIT